MDDEATTFQGTPVTIDVLNNDLNRDSATICNVKSTASRRNGCHQRQRDTLYARMQDSADRTTFTYSLCKTGCSQSETATVAVSVICCPKPMDDEATTFQGTPVTIDVLNNDLNKDSATICNVKSATAGGTAVHQRQRDNFIRPKAGFCGPDYIHLLAMQNWLQPIRNCNRSGQCHDAVPSQWTMRRLHSRGTTCNY